MWEQESFEAFFDALEDYIFIFDSTGKIIKANKAAISKLGYTLEELCDMNLLSMYPSERRAEVIIILQGVFQGKIASYSIPMYTKSEEYISVDTKVIKGNMKGKNVFFGISRHIYGQLDANDKFGRDSDAIERRQLLAQVEKQKDFLKSMMDAIPDLIFYKDRTSKYIGCNRAFAENFIGIREEEIIGKVDLDFIKDQELASFCRQTDMEIFEAYETKINEQTITMANGEVIDVESIKTPFYDRKGEIAGLIGIARDITARKRLQRQLKESELWLNMATSSAQIGLWEWHVASGETEVNEQWAALIGYTIDELAPVSIETWRRLTHPEDLKKVDGLLEKCFSGDLEYYECELRMKHKNGEWIWVLGRGKVIEWADKKPVRMVGIQINITKQKQVEEALRAERSLFIGGPTIVFLWKNADGWPVEYVSPNVYEIMGYTAEDFIAGKISYASIIHPDDLERTSAEVIIHTKGRADCFKQEYRIITASGETRWFEDFTVVKRNSLDEVTHYHGYMNDITDRKLIEAKMAHMDRLNIIGEVAAGIGHEVRNPMTTVRGYLQLFQRKAEFANYNDHFGTMIEELDRANSIITEFLSLAKDKSVAKKSGNLNNVVKTLFPILQAEAFQKGHQMYMYLGDIPDNTFDEKEIRQLILNMVRNGLEAMERRGSVTIRTYSEGENIILAVQDTGSGIPTEILDKLGTPFVTTKASGTGLGLSICYRIADRHGANIEVSTGSEGTTFMVAFSLPSQVLRDTKEAQLIC